MTQRGWPRKDPRVAGYYVPIHRRAPCLCLDGYAAVMPSDALVHWNEVRRRRLEELYTAHHAVGGTKLGRRTATEQLNWSVVLRLAAEFQGYCRDLHDEMRQQIVTSTYTMGAAHQEVLDRALVEQRRLDKGNANRSTIREDFMRFGFNLLDETKSGHRHGAGWLDRLEDLNTARNAAAHSNTVALPQCLAPTGYLRLAQVKKWDRATQGLSQLMDRICSQHLQRLLGGDAPW